MVKDMFKLKEERVSQLRITTGDDASQGKTQPEDTAAEIRTAAMKYHGHEGVRGFVMSPKESQ